MTPCLPHWGRSLAFGCVLAAFAGACHNEIDAGRNGAEPSDDGGNDCDCEATETCVQGECRPSCVSASCPQGTYCDLGDTNACLPLPNGCPGAPCPQGTICQEDGVCAIPPLFEPCAPNQTWKGVDGCPPNSLCERSVVVGQEPSCSAQAPCPASGVCEVGILGSVCNDGLLPNKARVCLSSCCLDETNCPEGWHCVNVLGIDLGVCSSGAPLMPCTEPAHCQSGVCSFLTCE